MSELRDPSSSGTPQDMHAFQPKAGAEVVELIPFSEGQVLDVMKGIKLDSAAGPDLVTRKMIFEWGVNVLRPIVNSFLRLGKIPDSLRINRTTLIPKKADPESVNDYRPVTIGSLVNRAYAKLLTKRLCDKVRLNSRQKAFVPVDGCSEHLFVVGEALEICQKRRKECNLVFL